MPPWLQIPLQSHNLSGRGFPAFRYGIFDKSCPPATKLKSLKPNNFRNLDSEKKAILEYFELPAQSFAESFQFRTYDDLSADPKEALRHYAQYGSPKGPVDAQTRYITEDVPMGLRFLSSIGRKAKIPTSVYDALITIASTMHQKDYCTQGRTLGQLGIDQYSVGELKNILEKGFPPDA